MIGLVLALAAALSWGASDFLGGLSTRDVPVARVLAVSQPLGLAACTVALVVSGQQLPAGRHLVEAVAAGAAAVLALGFLYVALARGNAVVAAPVAATGAAVPVLVGIVRGDPVTALTVTATVLTMAGIIGASWSPDGGQRGRNLLTVGFALGAALATGAYLTLIDLAGGPGNSFGVVEALRISASAIAIGVLLGRLAWAARRRPAERLVAVPAHAGTVVAEPDPEPATLGSGGLLLAMLGVGVTDAAAEVCFATASQHGHLSVVAVLAGLYPVVTVLLTLLILRERAHPVQALSAAAALAGVLLFAAS